MKVRLQISLREFKRIPTCHFAITREAISIQRRKTKALEDYTQSLQLKPDNPGGLVMRGQAYEHLGERDKALADFRAAVAIDPRFKEAEEGVKRLGQN